MSDYQSITLEESLGIDGTTGLEKTGVTNPRTTISEDNIGGIIKKTYKVSGVESLKISKLAFTSYYKLANVLGHELVHAIHIVNGNFQSWLNKYGAYKTKKIAEINAFKWNISVGDKSVSSKIKYYE
jgi:hypothetical protein